MVEPDNKGRELTERRAGAEWYGAGAALRRRSGGWWRASQCGQRNSEGVGDTGKNNAEFKHIPHRDNQTRDLEKANAVASVQRSGRSALPGIQP